MRVYGTSELTLGMGGQLDQASISKPWHEVGSPAQADEPGT